MSVGRRGSAAMRLCLVLCAGLAFAAAPLQGDPGAARRAGSAANTGARVPDEGTGRDNGRVRRAQHAEPGDDVDEEPAAAGDEAPTLAIPSSVEALVSPGMAPSSLGAILLMTVVSVVPSILIMTTCFVRFAIVLGLLRQALGTANLPPNQVLMGLCLFLTVLVMAPVWQESYDEGIRPYASPEPGVAAPPLDETLRRTAAPVRRFMFEQIENSDNFDTLWMLLDYHKANVERRGGVYLEPTEYDEVPLAVLVSGFLLSELKTAFIIGFQIYLPFLVIDLVVSTVLTGMGMMMFPPTLVSFPFKLLLFVLIDGWALTVQTLLEGVAPL